ncbi:hypothetical protein DYB28_001658 [Aphanomyces astaci]|uniref:Uncharacterized protein n=1 Tax=Aphanomyces astaci TaxID=112090 RepID=A0A9X8H8T6_APHAT|nr:hypothetical protein DYB28_001658 [Aphanomyces astaci]
MVHHVVAGKGVEMDDFQAKATLGSTLIPIHKCSCPRLEKACNGGHIHGCHHLGLMYLNALGGEKDISKGIEAIDKACAAGEGGSCFRLGSMYLTSQSKYGLSRDVVKAKAYLELSCDANYAPACHNLAVMYKTGDAGVPKDDDLFQKYSLKTKALAEQNSGGVAGGLKVA